MQLNQPPSIRLGVRNFIRQTSDSDGVCDLLHLVLHTGLELLRLQIAVNVHFVRPAGDNEYGDVPRVQDTGLENVDTSDIQDLSVQHQPVSGVLLVQRSIDIELGIREPCFKGRSVTLDISIEDLWEDVFAEFTQEWLELEVGVNLAHLADNHGGLVLGEETGETVGDVAGGLDEWVF